MINLLDNNAKLISIREGVATGVAAAGRANSDALEVTSLNIDENICLYKSQSLPADIRQPCQSPCYKLCQVFWLYPPS